MRTQLTDYGFHFEKIPMYCDSKAAIAISCNPIQHSRTKHLDVRYHFKKEKVEKGIVELFFVETEYQLADLFTKDLPEDRFKYLVRRLGMSSLTPEELEAQPTEKHLTAVKQIFWYLKDTIHMGLWYPKDTSFELTAFSDSDHTGCLDSRKSTSGGIQFLCGDKLVSWSSKKQDYYGFHFDKIPMYCDSKAAIAISCNPVQHSRTKHIDVRYHFIKEKIEKERFQYLVRRLGMRCLTPAELEALANESA
nr:hypothetical protein [Tanacetum cinerariifolium]